MRLVSLVCVLIAQLTHGADLDFLDNGYFIQLNNSLQQMMQLSEHQELLDTIRVYEHDNPGRVLIVKKRMLYKIMVLDIDREDAYYNKLILIPEAPLGETKRHFSIILENQLMTPLTAETLDQICFYECVEKRLARVLLDPETFKREASSNQDESISLARTLTFIFPIHQLLDRLLGEPIEGEFDAIMEYRLIQKFGQDLTPLSEADKKKVTSIQFIDRAINHYVKSLSKWEIYIAIKNLMLWGEFEIAREVLVKYVSIIKEQLRPAKIRNLIYTQFTGSTLDELMTLYWDVLNICGEQDTQGEEDCQFARELKDPHLWRSIGYKTRELALQEYHQHYCHSIPFKAPLSQYLEFKANTPNALFLGIPTNDNEFSGWTLNSFEMVSPDQQIIWVPLSSDLAPSEQNQLAGVLDGIIAPGNGDEYPETEEPFSFEEANVHPQYVTAYNMAKAYNIPYMGFCYGAQVQYLIEGGKVHEYKSIDDYYDEEDIIVIQAGTMIHWMMLNKEEQSRVLEQCESPELAIYEPIRFHSFTGHPDHISEELQLSGSLNGINAQAYSSSGMRFSTQFHPDKSVPDYEAMLKKDEWLYDYQMNDFTRQKNYLVNFINLCIERREGTFSELQQEAIMKRIQSCVNSPAL